MSGFLIPDAPVYRIQAQGERSIKQEVKADVSELGFQVAGQQQIGRVMASVAESFAESFGIRATRFSLDSLMDDDFDEHG